VLGLALAGQQVSASCASPADQLDGAWYVVGPCFVVDVTEHVGEVALAVFVFDDEPVVSLFGIPAVHRTKGLCLCSTSRQPRCTRFPST